MSDSDDIDRYLTMGESPDEDTIRSNLAKQGPSSVAKIIYRTLSTLRNSRDSFDHFLAGRFAELAVRQAFGRAGHLIIEIINSSPQGGSAVWEQLIPLIEHRDAGVRALATFFADLPGIPLNRTK